MWTGLKSPSICCWPHAYFQLATFFGRNWMLKWCVLFPRSNMKHNNSPPCTFGRGASPLAWKKTTYFMLSDSTVMFVCCSTCCVCVCVCVWVFLQLLAVAPWRVEALTPKHNNCISIILLLPLKLHSCVFPVGMKDAQPHCVFSFFLFFLLFFLCSTFQGGYRHISFEPKIFSPYPQKAL